MLYRSLINGTTSTSDMGIGSDEDEWNWEGLRSVMKLWFEVSTVELPNVRVKDIMIEDPTTVYRKTGIIRSSKNYVEERLRAITSGRFQGQPCGDVIRHRRHLDTGRGIRMVDASDILSLCKRRGFFFPSYEIYGGVAGMYDYGPLGTAMKNNIIEVWRRLYTLGEGFIEIDSETIGPEIVFKASGHVDEFADKMVSCRACKGPYRADHLAKDLHHNPGTLKEKELDELLKKNKVVCPACGGELTTVEEFNLMFKTMIGPGSGRIGYMRPETAQGIFVNFQNLYRYNREKLPLGVIQVGRGYRTRSPRDKV